MATLFKSLREFLYPDYGSKKFVIPNYQRGYKWSVRINNEQTSVEYLIDNLLTAYASDNCQQYFLQGITVVENGEEIILIDGQQRTTTLYLLLWSLGKEYIGGVHNIDLEYTIRKESHNFLNSLKKKDEFEEASKNDSQDIFYFKEALSQIKSKIDVRLQSYDDKKHFRDFIMDRISFLYVVVDQDKAIRTFSMMNGQKARMLDEELVKAEMLHLVSRNNQLKTILVLRTLEDSFEILKEVAAIDWETNALRSKYAREWDKWLYWWNRKDVMKYFRCDNPMGLLLEYYFMKQSGQEDFSFHKFKHLLPDNNQKATKDVFKGLRDLQKDFEDLYNDPVCYNFMKCALICSSGADDKYNIIMFFIANKKNESVLENYALWRMAGATHKEITEEYTQDPTAEEGQLDNKVQREQKAREMINKLSERYVYKVHDDLAFKQLLRLNVREFNRLKLPFDFSIWEQKSLEHIYPKSMCYHTEIQEDGTTSYIRGDGVAVSEAETVGRLDTTNGPCEHSIGNLVLLYGKNNSAFGNLPFEEKKEKLFNNERSFESRNLLHTISVFSSPRWIQEDIGNSTQKILNILRKDYQINN